MDSFGGIVDSFYKALPPGNTGGQLVKPPMDPGSLVRQGIEPVRVRVENAAPGTASTRTVLNKPGSIVKYTPKLPKGFIKGKIGPTTLKGGLVETAIGLAAQPAIDFMGREAVRGAQVVTGQDTTGFDNFNAGRPVVKNVDGTSFNIATPEGMSGYQKVMRAGGKKSEPKFKPNEEVTPITGFDTLTPEQTTSALKIAGTDTSSGDRESLRAAGGDPAMAAWAKANPELAKRMVDKVDARRNRGLEGKQTGYEAVRNELYPERAVLASEGNLGGFSVDDAVDGGMSSKEAEAIASGGFVETVFDKGVQGESKITNNSAEKATDLLNNYTNKITETFAEALPPSATQNPIPMGGDGTAIDSELELSKKASALVPEMGNVYKRYG